MNNLPWTDERLASIPDLGRQLALEQLTVGVGAGDPLTARLIQRAGFGFVWASSLAISASRSLSEASAISSGELLRSVVDIAHAVDIPTIVDSHISYIGKADIAHVMQCYDEAGVAAVSIEDKSHPKTNSLDITTPQTLMPTDAFIEIFQTARNARKRNMLLIARVEALIAGAGVQETLRRMDVYAGAGADAIIVHSRAPSPSEIIEVVTRWNGTCPLGLIPTTYPSLNEQSILSLGKVKFVIYANQMLRASLKAQIDLLEEIKEARGLQTISSQLTSVEYIFDLVGDEPSPSRKQVGAKE